MADRNEIRLVFRPLPDAMPWPSRLRMLLKIALRVFRLKRERIEMLPTDSKKKQEPS